VQRTEGL